MRKSMMTLSAAVEIIILLLGHLAIWCTVYNQLHATAWPRPSRKFLEKIIYLVTAWIGYLLIRQSWTSGLGLWNGSGNTQPQTAYNWLCVVAAAFVTGRWLFRRITAKTPSRLVKHRQTLCDLRREFARAPVHGVQASLLNLIPGNQIFAPVIEHKTIAVRGLPAASSGFRIVQLSDLHFTGKVGIEYFQRIIELCNQAEPDLVLLTGDIIDKSHCLDWLPPTLGQVRAKLGRFYVLGNHDRRVKDTTGLRHAIEAIGFESINGRWHRLAIPGGCLWLCGNELPWYRGAESLPIDPPTDSSAPRILAAHTPDQMSWALERHIDLMLAGHCHGGQIRLPLIGPIITPSRYGVRFASGAFEFSQLTLLVSRGISGDDPIRLNCPPELTVIELLNEA